MLPLPPRQRHAWIYIGFIVLSLLGTACNWQSPTPPNQTETNLDNVFKSELPPTHHFALEVVAVSASANDGNVPENTLDENLSTRWSALGNGQWIEYDLGRPHTVGAVEIAFYRGDKRVTMFDIEISLDGSSWSQVFTGQSSGASKELENFSFTGLNARYVRVLGRGNSENDWNSLTEVEIHEGYEPNNTGLPDGFVQVQVLAGIPDIRGIRPLPDGRMLIWTYRNVIYMFDGGQLLKTPFLTVPPVIDQTERALFGVEPDPDFESNGYVYVYYRWHETLQNRVSRFTVSASNPNTLDPNSERVLLDKMTERGVFHNGGGILFDTDGYLYIAIGDTGRGTYGQDLSTLMGSVIRLSPDNYPNVIPQDNPFMGVSGARAEIWAYGFRNPFSAAIDPATNRIFINDVGKDSWEEVNLLKRGGNYGWATLEGPSTDPAFETPWHSYPHLEGPGGDCAITGGASYTETAFPAEFRNNYFFFDYCGRWLKRIRPNGTVVDFAPAVTPRLISGNPIDLRIGADGQLYYASQSDGAVYSIRYQNNVPPIAAFDAQPSTGQAPLVVSFDASASSDPDGDPLSYLWDFGDGSATSTAVQVSHRYEQEGVFRAMLTVTDSQGESTTVIQEIVVGISPTTTINLPSSERTYKAGESIAFEGSATDAVDGVLAASAFQWTIVFHHDDHTHPHSSLTEAKEGSFTADDTTEPSTNTWYRILLTATNSRGLATTVTRDIYPQVSSFTLATEPPGLTVNVNGTPTTSPFTMDGIVNFNFTLGAETQTLNGQTYRFIRWSDGGAATHDIRVPETPTTYTAYFECSSCEPEQPEPLVSSSTLAATSQNFSSKHPVENLWDGCLQTYLGGQPACTAGAANIDSFWLSFDFGQAYTLSQARLFGDAGGNWVSSSWTLEYRLNLGDPWTPAFSNKNAFTNNWVNEPLSVTARYVRVTIYGNPNGRGTQARELELYGTPANSSPTNLVNSSTYLSDSNNFESRHPVTNLWDGCLKVYENGQPVCTAAANKSTSFWVSFDFGQRHQLSHARLFGDTGGNWRSSTWGLDVRSNPNDPWQAAFSTKDAFLNDWLSEPLSVTARYVRVTIYDSTVGTQARELEIYGVPSP